MSGMMHIVIMSFETADKLIADERVAVTGDVLEKSPSHLFRATKKGASRQYGYVSTYDVAGTPVLRYSEIEK